MLNKKDPCVCCPKEPHYNSKSLKRIYWENLNEVCDICQHFIGYENTLWKCPCHKGKKEAIKRTWLALEEKGYM